jgi:hypothetical protein
MIQKLRVDMHLSSQDKISTRMINEFTRQCPYCQISNRLKITIKTHPYTYASYNPFDVLHLDLIGPLPKDELVTELLRLGGIEQSFAAAYSSEENGIVERVNQEVLCHLRAYLLIQRIMNTVEKTSTGVTPAEMILSYSIRLSSHILAPIDSSVDDTSLLD